MFRWMGSWQTRGQGSCFSATAKVSFVARARGQGQLPSSDPTLLIFSGAGSEMCCGQLGCFKEALDPVEAVGFCHRLSCLLINALTHVRQFCARNVANGP